MEYLTILAIILGPILAVQIESHLEKNRELRKRREKVFALLMATRATILSQQHVEALNVIDVIFYSKGDRDKNAKAVREAWKIYLDHLFNVPLPENKSANEIWDEKRKDLLASLLKKMAECLEYDYDEVLLKRAAYYPKAHGDIELELNFIRRKVANILLGENAFPMKVTSFPELTEEGKQLNEEMMKIYSGKTPIKVKFVNNSEQETS